MQIKFFLIYEPVGISFLFFMWWEAEKLKHWRVVLHFLRQKLFYKLLHYENPLLENKAN